jgi:hypothetical protein
LGNRRLYPAEGHGQIFLGVAQVGADFFNKKMLERSPKLFTAALYEPHPRERSHDAWIE